MKKRLARIAAALCLMAVPFVVMGGAGADSASAFGWWNQLNDAALPVAPPPPPNAPSGGIYVQNTPAGPTAIGAVRFSNPTATAGTVKFNVENSSPAVEVALCPTTKTWQAADNGVWQERPTFDCSIQKVLGVLNDDASVLTFEVTDAIGKAGVYDLAIVPDPVVAAVFELGLAAPGSDFFTVTSTTQPTVPPVGDPIPPATSPPPIDSGNSFGADVSDAPAADAGNFLDEPAEEPTPETAAPAEGGGTAALPTAPTAASGRDGPAGQRIAAGIGLVLLAGALWFVGNRQASGLTPELLKAGAINSSGGIGRFARVRTTEPTRLS